MRLPPNERRLLQRWLARIERTRAQLERELTATHSPIRRRILDRAVCSNDGLIMTLTAFLSLDGCTLPTDDEHHAGNHMSEMRPHVHATSAADELSRLIAEAQRHEDAQASGAAAPDDDDEVSAR